VSSDLTLEQEHPAEADGIPTLQRALAAATAEHAFDRLNPDFGIAADHYQREGHRAVQQREAALALGTRTAVALHRENEPRPPVRLAGQDDRVAAAVRAARARQGPERTGPERQPTHPNTQPPVS
jgi:hypothetical protein